MTCSGRTPGGAYPYREGSLTPREVVVEAFGELRRLTGQVESGSRVKGFQDHARRGESGDDRRSCGRVIHRERLLDPLASLAALSADIPEPLQRGDRPPGGLDVASGDAVSQCGPQVRLLCDQQVEPGPLVRSTQLLCGFLGQGEVVHGVLSPDCGVGAGDGESFRGVRANCL
jgi:hypothetical protein